jgi:hypothetical protein
MALPLRFIFVTRAVSVDHCHEIPKFLLKENTILQKETTVVFTIHEHHNQS